MFAKAGFSGAVNGDEVELDTLARTLVVSGDEATVAPPCARAVSKWSG